MSPLRKELHLSQREFAHLIGVSPAVVSLYEKGDRKLPAKAMNTIIQLQLRLQNMRRLPDDNETATPNPQKDVEANTAEVFKSEIRKATLKILELRDKLTEMQQTYQHLLQKQKTLKQLALQLPAEDPSLPFIKKIACNTSQELQVCDREKQKIITYKITLLQARINIAGTLLSGEQPALPALEDFPYVNFNLEPNAPTNYDTV